jgi:hypothetical protein
MLRLKPTLARTIWRWVPSPQSNITMSRPSFNTALLLPRVSVGMLPLVPKKTSLISTPAGDT